MTRLEMIIAVSDVLLRKYGEGDVRKANLTKTFGSTEAENIQKEVNKCLSDSA